MSILKNTLSRVTTSPLPFDLIPGPKPSLPFIGTSWIYLPIVGHYKSMKLHEANLDKYHRYGPIMKEEYQRGRPSVTIYDPSDIKEVFVREGACPVRPVIPFLVKHRQSDPTRYPNIGLANMMGHEWHALRSQLAPLFLSREAKVRHMGSQNRVSTRLVNYIKSKLAPSGHTHNNYHNHHLDQQRRRRQANCKPSNDEPTTGGASPSDQPPNAGGMGLLANVQEVFYRFSMESIMNLCINQEIGCLDLSASSLSSCVEPATQLSNLDSDGERIFQAVMNFFEAQHKLYYGSQLWKYFETSAYKQLRDSQDAIHDIASKYIDVALLELKRKHHNQKNTTPTDQHNSLLETLFSTNKFSDLVIKSTIVDSIGGGIYTVANTLTMALFLLASNPQVQEQLYEEICHVFKEDIENNTDIHIDLERLDKMHFLKSCLKESHRLLPTIPGIARIIQKDLVLSNYLVPKDTLVFCNFMVTCRLPQYFDDPDTYNPNRWDRAGKSKSDLAFASLPFGHGVRKCIGHNFAELEIYVALAKLIRTFKVRTVDSQDAKSLELSYKFIVVPEKPVTLQFTPRHPQNDHDNER